MTHKTQLVLDDKQVVFLANAAHLAVVILKAHPDVQNDKDCKRAMAMGFLAIAQTSPDTLRSTIIALQTASADVVENSNGNIRAVTHESEPIEGLDTDYKL